MIGFYYTNISTQVTKSEQHILIDVNGRRKTKKKKEKWISKENCCYITNTRATEKTESSEEYGIILNCISYQDWVGWNGWFRTQT